MIRKAFKMSVYEDCVDEYVQRHNPIWEELEAVFETHGVKSYSIFLDPDENALFAYVEVEDEAQWEAIAETEVCQQWWHSMRDLMPTNPDDSPESTDLREVFHFE